MERFSSTISRIFFASLMVWFAILTKAQAQVGQTLHLTDFAIWGGSAAPTSYNSLQGVFINNTTSIEGNIGSNHLISIKNNLTLKGNIYSANRILFQDYAKITGSVFANRVGTNIFPIIGGGYKDTITGNLTANGKIFIGSGKIIGQVAVPSPSATNYTGPVPSAGITNTLTLPVMPTMPNNTPFDSKVGTVTITNPTTPLLPGVYRKLALTGNKTLTFSGPGNYIFYEVNNSTTTNKFVFDFKNTATGTINIYIIKDARWGNLTVSTKNGNYPSRIYTEVHGDGSTFGGFSFDLKSSAIIPNGSYVWLGNVWAPNGAISVINTPPCTTARTHIIGALWSGKMVYLKNDLKLVYQAPETGPNFIAPYYPPPASGKVNTANNVIGAELFSISQNSAPITSIPSNEIFILDNAGKVMIEVISKTPNDTTLKTQLKNLGMTGILNNGPDVYIITGFFPISNITQLNSNTRIAYVRPLYPPISNAGQVTTRGDSTMRSNFVRTQFGLDGSGVKIGVISDSYNTKLVAQNDVDQDDLPGIKTNGQPNDNPEPVQVVQDLSQRGNDEGRAMLQIVHDIAPQSKLAFRTGFLTAGDFANGIQELASPNLPGGRCDVIVDDITYVTEPFLRDGIVSQTVDSVAAQGVTYFSSAGNFGKQSYENIFNGVTNASIIPTGQIHKFGATNNDIYQTVKLKPGSYTIVLQWSDEFLSLGTAGVQTDMDLYIVGPTGLTLFGFNRSNLFGDPFEVCPFTVDEETNAKIMVVRATGTANVRFKYIIFRGDATLLDYPSGTSTIVGHPNANGAIAVGAMLYANIPQYTPVWPGVASFSSTGGTYTLQNNVFAQRNKPDLIAPNGVNTTVNLGGPSFNDGDPYPNFFGTSAAAPHAAAVAALLIQGRKKFNLQPTVTPDEIRQQLQSSAGKFSSPSENFSFEGGYGFIQADAAAQQISNAKPILDSLIAITPGDQNGNQPFMVKLKGKYLTSTSVIYANGSPVPTSVSQDKTEATAMVPAIPPGQDPPFQIFNSAKSPSHLDSGSSEPLYFFSTKVNVTIRAENKSRKYGQENPFFTAQVLVNGVALDQTNITLADLKLDGSNITFTTIATPTSSAGLYGIFPSRSTPLDNNDTLFSKYRFTFVSGTLSVGKMLLKITPENKQIKYGDYPGDITYNYALEQSPSNTPVLLEEVKALHKKYLADNGLVVINDFNTPDLIITPDDLLNMSTLASFQSIRNARKFVLENGQLKPIANTIPDTLIGDQRFIVDVAKQSLVNYKLDSSQSNLVQSPIASTAKGFLNLKALSNGNAKAAIPNGQLKPMVNGQLMAMVNGQLQALVNGQLKALVNNVFVNAADLVFRNGVLLALVNNNWISVTNGQLQAIVNELPVTVDLSVQANGQLKAIANGEIMPLVNGQLQASVNGELLAIVNGQLKALVNGQLMPLVNGQLMAIVNGQLKAIANGKLVAIINGQLMALVNGELEIVENLQLSNGQLKAIVNGQLKPMVNGQLKAMVNGLVTDIPTDNFNIVNGQLQAIVNGQLLAMVNGQLLAIINGQLKPLVNGAAIAIDNVTQLANGQLKALVNGTYIPITNGQLQAMVNGQLQAMVNGQLMAIVNGELTFVVFETGQLNALVNGQLQALVNGQLKAIVNGQLQDVNSYNIVNGQLQAIVNNETWVFPNGQLKAIVNGQLKPLVNNFDVTGQNNNAKTLVLVDQDDINLQSGDVGGMFSVNMITGLGVGLQTLIPGAFINENFEVTYQPGYIDILPSPLIVKADDTTKKYGAANPAFTLSYSGFQYDDDETAVIPPLASCEATNNSGVGPYPINITGGTSPNYSFALYQPGTLTVNKKTLYVKANDTTKAPADPTPVFNISYDGLVGDDTEDSVCLPYRIPSIPTVIEQLVRRTTYTNVKINDGSNVYNAQPGESITLTGNWNEEFINPGNPYCPGCITQLYIGLSNAPGFGTIFTYCNDVSGLSSYSGTINQTFNAPTIPGVYYITQVSTWEYSCYDRGSGLPGNDPNNAIAVIVVNISNEKITATTTAQQTPGVFPITLQGCNGYNPNYDVILQNGQITVAYPPSPRSSRITTPTKTTEDQIAKIAASKLYPNPGHALVMLQLQNEVNCNSQVKVYDAVGKLNSVPIKRIGDGKYEINVSALPKGLYIVNAKTLSGNETFRFVKL